MKTGKTYESFPFWIVSFSNLCSLLIYILGLTIILELGWAYSILYLVFILAYEYRLIRYHCVNCYYWGKLCGFGRGRISSLFFKKGEPAKFCAIEMKLKDLIPDLLLSFIPIIVGIIILILKFNWFILFAVFMIIFLTTFGNGFIRGKLTCNFCKQKELGCPAEKLFNKK